MSSKQHALLPAGRASGSSSATAASQSPCPPRTMPRRHLTQNACLGCRKKRAKCDGKLPCSRCIDRKVPCDYEDRASVTKDDLRAEVKTLKRERLNNRAVLRALLLDKHEAIVQRLRSGETVDAIARSLGGNGTGDGANMEEISEGGHEMPSSPQLSTSKPLGSAGIGQESVSSSVSFDKGLLTPIDTPSPSTGTRNMRPAASRRHSFNGNLLARGLSVAGSGTWTTVTPNRAIVNHLVQLFFSWEFPLFTMLSQDHFLRDFYGGGRQFCSPALVNAIASVATRHLESDQVQDELGETYLLGERFFRESRKLLVSESQTTALSSIQALALLALREMSCGRELEAQALCLQACRRLTVLDVEDLEGLGPTTDLLAVRSVTFSGVLSLARAIRLITDQVSPTSPYCSADAPLASVFGEHVVDGWAVRLDEQVVHLRNNLPLQTQPSVAEVLGNFIFEQTDRVYTFLSRAGAYDNQTRTERLCTVYQKCLASYESITAFLRGEQESSPYTLFMHIYFHFCLLVLFRPFADQQVQMAGVSPRTICDEAIQAILSLTQSYASLFTLRRTPCFIPYFVFAAGLTRIVLENLSRKTDEWSSDSMSTSGAPSSTPSSNGTESSPAANSTDTRFSFSSWTFSEGEDTFMSGTETRENSLSPTATTKTDITTTGSEEDPGLTQAVLQLEQMSSGHPAAAQAGWVLRDFDMDHSSSF